LESSVARTQRSFQDNEARWLRALEEENRRWKAPVAELSLDRKAGDSSQWLIGPPELMKIRAGTR
jgi:hypothetical protein